MKLDTLSHSGLFPDVPDSVELLQLQLQLALELRTDLGQGLATAIHSLQYAREAFDLSVFALSEQYSYYISIPPRDTMEEQAAREELRRHQNAVYTSLAGVASAANQLVLQVSREVRRLTNEVAVRNRYVAASSRTARRGWLWSWVLIGALAPVAMLWLRRRIEDIEEDIRDLEWHTETRTQLFNVLTDMLGDKVRQRWTPDDLIGSVAEYQHGKGSRYAAMVMALSAPGFAQFLMDRAQLAGLVAVSEMVVDGALVECYEVRGMANGEAAPRVQASSSSAV